MTDAVIPGGTTSFTRRAILAAAAVLPSASFAPARAASLATPGALLKNVDVRSWHMPPLRFVMTDADTGHEVTAKDFRGKVVVLYFGYTNCPDVCPLTLHNIAVILGRLGKQAADVSVLFVTVDPHRDTLPALRRYTKLFSPRIIGLRGTASELASFAHPYHIGYSVSPATATHPYEVSHSAIVYVFAKNGEARWMVPSLASTTPDIAGTVADVRRLVSQSSGGVLASVGHLF